MQEVFGVAVVPPNAPLWKLPHCRGGNKWSGKAFPTFLVLPLLPSVSMKEVAPGSSEAREGKTGWDRESYKQDLSIEAFGYDVQHSGLGQESRCWDEV